MYPKRLYSPNGGSITVEDAAHERAMGKGWSENPPAPLPEVVPSDPPPPADPGDNGKADKKTRKS